MRGVPSYAPQNVQLQHSLRAAPLWYLFFSRILKRNHFCFQVGLSLSRLHQSQLVKCVLVVTADFSSRHRLLLKAQHPVTSHLAFAPNRKKKCCSNWTFCSINKTRVSASPNYVAVLSKPSISKSSSLSVPVSKL